MAPEGKHIIHAFTPSSINEWENLTREDYFKKKQIYFKFLNPTINNAEYWILEISPEGFGFLGMILNFGVALIVSNFYSNPPKEIYQMIDEIRKP